MSPAMVGHTEQARESIAQFPLELDRAITILKLELESIANSNGKLYVTQNLVSEYQRLSSEASKINLEQLFKITLGQTAMGKLNDYIKTRRNERNNYLNRLEDWTGISKAQIDRDFQQPSPGMLKQILKALGIYETLFSLPHVRLYKKLRAHVMLMKWLRIRGNTQQKAQLGDISKLTLEDCSLELFQNRLQLKMTEFEAHSGQTWTEQLNLSTMIWTYNMDEDTDIENKDHISSNEGQPPYCLPFSTPGQQDSAPMTASTLNYNRLSSNKSDVSIKNSQEDDEERGDTLSNISSRI